ncbi:hypothetical protein RJ639_003785 [Escallonia herrerae]|uniref:Uncharacterized protein n=1 Tax=Escallonia herrerae TaxID=1293975 RepID=A0AA89AYV5_9ASTE|nr:hypothetical protein RJ639_003785 [Escallonia herrerae]
MPRVKRDNYSLETTEFKLDRNSIYGLKNQDQIDQVSCAQVTTIHQTFRPIRRGKFFRSLREKSICHVSPSRANEPGLVYDIHPNDYIQYLCGLGYTDKQVGLTGHSTISYLNESSITEAQLNYLPI